MKLLLISLLFVVVGCSDSTFNENKQEILKDEFEKEEIHYKYVDVKFACELGCRYDFDLYSVANSLRKESVSLTSEQLESIKDRCNTVCEKKVLDSVIKRIKLENEHYEKAQETQGFETKQEKPKVKKELIPFEEL